MPVLLYRIDERLIHGQVVVGWGGVLEPDLIVVVDDDLAASAWEQELYTLGVPAQIETAFRDVATAREEVAGWRAGDRRVVVLTRDPGTMWRLAEGGHLRGEEVNLGGLHASPGRRPILSYLYLGPEEEARLRDLEGEGVTISARDLPGSRRVVLADLLRERSGR